MAIRKRRLLKNEGGRIIETGTVIARVDDPIQRPYVFLKIGEPTPKHGLHIVVIAKDSQTVGLKERVEPEEFGLRFA